MSERHRQKQTTAPPATLSAKAVVEAAPAPIHVWRSFGLFLILLAGMLFLWQLVLLHPLQTLSRGAIQGCFVLLPFSDTGSNQLITVDRNNGDWIVHASLLHLPERDLTRQIAGSQEAGVRLEPAMLQVFSVCFPIFWALSLAVWPGKRLWRVLGIGTLVLAIVSQMLLVLFLAHWINRYFIVASAPWTGFCLQFVGYCTLNVVPYAAPLVLIIWLHPRLRSLVFGVFPSRTQPVPGP